MVDVPASHVTVVFGVLIAIGSVCLRIRKQKRSKGTPNPEESLCLAGRHLSREKKPLTFHYTGCLIGILRISLVFIATWIFGPCIATNGFEVLKSRP